MVGIVVVSHSKALAEAVCDLARQTAGETRICGAGGVGERLEEFGTDATAIMEAIESVCSDDGVLVLMDMGSALLSAQTALALLSEDTAEKVVMCSAPLVEGAIVAAVLSSTGADISEVKAEVLRALCAKQKQLGDSPPEDTGNAKAAVPDHALRRDLTIRNEHGLHARPAAQFVICAARHDAHVYVGTQDVGKQPVSARSLNSLAALNIRLGDTITVYAWGKQAEAALGDLESLAESGFGEAIPEKQKRPDSSQSPETIELSFSETSRLCLCPGIAMGNAWKIGPMIPVFEKEICNDSDSQMTELDALLERALNQLDQDMENHDDPAARDMLGMHRVMMLDPSLLEKAREIIRSRHLTAPYAWWTVCRNVAESYAAIEDNTYLQARASDLTDIGFRVLRGSEEVTLPDSGNPPDDCVIFADDISLDLMTRIAPEALKGIVTHSGSTTSHAAILARSRGVPTISGFQGIDTVESYMPVIVDAAQTLVVFNPDKNTTAEFRRRMHHVSQLRGQLASEAHDEARTTDGIPIVCSANVGSMDEVLGLSEYGAQGVGLFRSEFLFLDRRSPPDEEEQFETYAAAAQALSGQSLTIRLLDIGGDKQIPYLSLAREDNPFLGMRGVRIGLRCDDLSMPQLRALLRASSGGDVKIMIPMVVDAEEICAVKEKLNLAREQLVERDVPCASSVPVGVMIETPAGAVSIRELAREVDFFSIGTNDLVQYVLAAERGNAGLSDLYDVCHPAVIRTLKIIVEGASATGTPLSLCGEAGSDLEAIPLLIGMGIRTFSLTARRIPAIKYLVRRLSYNMCVDAFHHALDMGSAKDVRAHMRGLSHEMQALFSVM